VITTPTTPEVMKADPATAAAANVAREKVVANRPRADKLDAVGRIAADELADDFEANLEIEARIAARHAQRRSTEEQVRDVLHGVPDRGGSRE
jgi:hypothetical protein